MIYEKCKATFSFLKLSSINCDNDRLVSGFKNSRFFIAGIFEPKFLSVYTNKSSTPSSRKITLIFLHARKLRSRYTVNCAINHLNNRHRQIAIEGQLRVSDVSEVAIKYFYRFDILKSSSIYTHIFHAAYFRAFLFVLQHFVIDWHRNTLIIKH